MSLSIGSTLSSSDSTTIFLDKKTDFISSPAKKNLIQFPDPDKKIKGTVVDLKSNKTILTFEEDALYDPHWFANDSHLLVKTDHQDGEQITLWNLNSGHQLLSGSCRESSLRGSRLLLNTTTGFIVWDCESGKALHSVTVDKWPTADELEHAALSPELQSIFVQKKVSDYEINLSCYELTGKQLFSLKLTSLTELNIGLCVDSSTEKHYLFKGDIEGDYPIQLTLAKDKIDSIRSIDFDTKVFIAEILYTDGESELQTIILPKD